MTQRFFTFFLAAVISAALAGLTSTARAQDETRDFSVERFSLAMDSQGVLDVEWGAVPTHKSWDIALWLGAADDPLVVSAVRDGDRDRVGALVSQRIAGTLSASVSLWSRFQVGVDLPLILSQDEDSITGVTMMDALSGFGLGDVRILPKVQLLFVDDHDVNLSIIPAVTLPSGSGEDYRGEDGVSFAPEIALGRALGPWRLAGNLGYRARRNTEVANLAVEDELFARLGLGYRFSDAGGPPLEIDVTASAATAASAPLDSFAQNHLELRSGAAYRVAGPLLAVVAGGLGLNEGFGTPDWRVLAGVRLSQHGDRDRDGDGILDRADACPKVAEDIDGFQDENGCPDPDNDNDGVPDRQDGAPDEPEDVDRYADADGVPDPDNDEDGILDQDDKCPDQAETRNDHLDDDGCPDEVPDSDGDGLADNVDRCPQQPEDNDSFEDSDGCPDLDNDKDQVADQADGCPDSPGPAENRGCPDTDRDGDKVVDRLDNCPDEAGDPANQGCKQKQLVKIQDGKLEILEKVFFASNRARIRQRSFKLLRNVATVLAAHPDIRIQVEGHTDDRGDDAHNLALSQQRAEAVVAFLVKQGIAAERLVPMGFGEVKPLEPNTTRAGRAKNRRVEFKIVGSTGTPEAPVIQTPPDSPSAPDSRQP